MPGDLSASFFHLGFDSQWKLGGAISKVILLIILPLGGFLYFTPFYL